MPSDAAIRSSRWLRKEMLRDNQVDSAHTGETFGQFGERQYNRSSVMAKSQLRGNREAKKPKQSKKPLPVSLPSGSRPIKAGPTSLATEKKR
jgi:hypothetical protein